MDNQTRFISLGSVCEPNHMLRLGGFKDATYPFDWIVSMDGEKLMAILRDDFRYFLDEDKLAVYDVGGGPLLNTHYWLEFLHEGDWRGEGFEPNMAAFKPRYQRRIERFRRLGNHAGPLCFLRAAYRHSLDDRHRRYHVAENLEIADEYAVRLGDALVRFFPHADVRLLIINLHIRTAIEEEAPLSERVLKIRVNPDQDVSVKVEQHRAFFEQFAARQRHR